MASSHNIEMEAAKFLHKLIQESKDEPAKLAAKLLVILQHMKDSGKENSMPYQVISRAMETVINQHGLDIEALKSSRLPSAGGNQIGESITQQVTGSSQVVAIAKDSKLNVAEDEMAKLESFPSGRPPVGPTSSAHDIYQGSVSHRSGRSLDHESPSSLDSRSANSLSQERQDAANWEKQASQSDSKKSRGKRKRSDSSLASESKVENPQQFDSSNIAVNLSKVKTMTTMEPSPSFSSKGGAPGLVHGGIPGSSSLYSSSEPGFSSHPMQFNVSSYGSHDFLARSHKERNMEAFSAMNFSPGKFLEHDSGIPNSLANANKITQAAGTNSFEMGVSRSGVPRDTGKSPTTLIPSLPGILFKDQHLKQLRAQCMVFLAFRNGMMPKRLHLEIALGNMHTKEDESRKEPNDHKGKEQSSSVPSCIREVNAPVERLFHAREADDLPLYTSSAGSFSDMDPMVKEGEYPQVMKENNRLSYDPSVVVEERKRLFAARTRLETEVQAREVTDSMAFPTTVSQPEISSMKNFPVSNYEENLEDVRQQVGRTNQGPPSVSQHRQIKPEMVGIGNQNDSSSRILSASYAQHETVSNRNVSNSSQSLSGFTIQRNQNGDSIMSTHLVKEHWKPVPGQNDDHRPIIPVRQSNDLTQAYQVQQKSSEHTEDNKEYPSPKHTTSEKWVINQQKQRVLVEQKWMLKQRKTEKIIAACFDRLKETVSSSEDISSKTKSVIELKKLQLLKLQRRLRSDFLNDFFKPIVAEMDRLKSFKKNRPGRRLKQIEKYEQKMKEERQKRIRERQKEFFIEFEAHKERLDDVFKIKKERWKGFNRYIKEFHKRKERIHREKIDRIQREKINLLKINDVEGYLRMVQDAKSDRVKQLLKATEKYLQKLGSKLRDAKVMSRGFELDMGENQTMSVDETNETFIENDDENDQAKHYLESNEKYYLMAHSIKESIARQPTSLVSGQLREYQMNGLRWLVSLYNNHLNGILADEMGLGKTVQVIALICYLMETKNDRGPFLVVVPSSVLPGWELEISSWSPGVNKIVYAGTPEERRKLFKEKIVHQKFNVLLTTYEYLMNKHDRPKLSKIQWHYVIIDEGHRIKNASCKLNAELKHYQSSHRLLLTGTPLQNNLEELWALLNFLLPNIFNSSEDFSQWFNKPFESNGDNSADEALLSEEENLLIINRLHQVLRPFVLRRLKHKVENELPEKIERLVRCDASAYQKLLMKRVEDNLGSIGSSKVRSVHNSVMELRNICNHPYLSHLHAEEVDSLMPKHYLPPIVRLCGKLEMLDRLLPKLKATDHRVLFFSTMTRLLDVMEDYLYWKRYRYLRLDGHTSGNDRGALIEKFNRPNSDFFIFLLSIRAGGVGVNLQAADTVIIFDTDWNPQVDLQAQARAHRIGQKRDVLVLRLETVQTVEEQVRASAEHKLGVANQSITAGFFDNNTSAEDRREYLESLLRECKKEEAAPVLDDDALNDILARSESEIDIFESVDKQRREEEMATWEKIVSGQTADDLKSLPSLPSRLVTDADLKVFYEAMNICESNTGAIPNAGLKRKSQNPDSLDTKQYGRGKRAREVRSYEEQWTEEEFEKICQVESPDSPKKNEENIEKNVQTDVHGSVVAINHPEPPSLPLQPTLVPLAPSRCTDLPIIQNKEVTPPSRRGRGRPRRATSNTQMVVPAQSVTGKAGMFSPRGTVYSFPESSCPQSLPVVTAIEGFSRTVQCITTSSQSILPSPPAIGNQSTPSLPSVSSEIKGQAKQTQKVEAPRRKGKKQNVAPPIAALPVISPSSLVSSKVDLNSQGDTNSGIQTTPIPTSFPVTVKGAGGTMSQTSAPASATVKGTSVTMPMTSVPASATAKGLSGIISQTSAPASATVKGVSGTISQTSVPASATVKGVSGTISQTPVPASATVKGVSGTISQTSVPASAVVKSMSGTISQTSVPATATVKGTSGTVSASASATVKSTSGTVSASASATVKGTSGTVSQTSVPVSTTAKVTCGTISEFGVGMTPISESMFPLSSVGPNSKLSLSPVALQAHTRGQGRKGVAAPRRRGKKQIPVLPSVPNPLVDQGPKPNLQLQKKDVDSLKGKMSVVQGLQNVQYSASYSQTPPVCTNQDANSNKPSVDMQQLKSGVEDEASNAHTTFGLMSQDTGSKKQSDDKAADQVELQNVALAGLESQNTASSKESDDNGGVSEKLNNVVPAQVFAVNPSSDLFIHSSEHKKSASSLESEVCAASSIPRKSVHFDVVEPSKSLVSREGILPLRIEKPCTGSVAGVVHTFSSEISSSAPASLDTKSEKESEERLRDLLGCKTDGSANEQSSDSQKVEEPRQVQELNNSADQGLKPTILSEPAGSIITDERFPAEIEASQTPVLGVLGQMKTSSVNVDSIGGEICSGTSETTQHGKLNVESSMQENVQELKDAMQEDSLTPEIGKTVSAPVEESSSGPFQAVLHGVDALMEDANPDTSFVKTRVGVTSRSEDGEDIPNLLKSETTVEGIQKLMSEDTMYQNSSNLKETSSFVAADSETLPLKEGHLDLSVDKYAVPGDTVASNPAEVESNVNEGQAKNISECRKHMEENTPTIENMQTNSIASISSKKHETKSSPDVTYQVTTSSLSCLNIGAFSTAAKNSEALETSSSKVEISESHESGHEHSPAVPMLTSMTSINVTGPVENLTGSTQTNEDKELISTATAPASLAEARTAESLESDHEKSVSGPVSSTVAPLEESGPVDV